MEALVKKVGFKPGVKTEAVMDEIDEMSRQKKRDNLTCARRYESLHWNGRSWQNESAGSLPSAETTLRLQPGIERVQALADISRSTLLLEQRNPCTDSKSAQYCATIGHPLPLPRYIRVRAVVWECEEGQTHRHTDGRDQYTFRPGLRLTRNVITNFVTDSYTARCGPCTN